MASKKVLVLNAGSSSLKFKLFDNVKNQLVASVSGLIERIGDTSNSQVSWLLHAQVTCCSPGFTAIPQGPDNMLASSYTTGIVATHLTILKQSHYALQLVGNILTGDNQGKATHKEAIKDHTSALDVAMNYLQDSYSKSVRQQVHAIGHRVVHGKDTGEAKLVTPDIEKLIQDAAAVAPLHNPANLQGITAAKSIFPGQPQAGLQFQFINT